MVELPDLSRAGGSRGRQANASATRRSHGECAQRPPNCRYLDLDAFPGAWWQVRRQSMNRAKAWRPARQDLGTDRRASSRCYDCFARRINGRDNATQKAGGCAKVARTDMHLSRDESERPSECLDSNSSA